MGIMFKKFYDYFREKNIKHAGIYLMTTPVYMPMDLDILKEVITKHFDHFDERGMFYNEKLQPVTAHLFQLGGARWRRLRVKLTPTFTSGKMKMMFPAVVECTKPLLESVEGNKTVNMKEICAKFTINVIGSCAFGIECNSYKNTEFHYYGTRVFKTDTKRALSRNIQLIYPKIATWLSLLPFPQEVVDFFMNMITETVKMREESGQTRNDFIQLLIELKNKENKEEALTMMEVLAEGWLFFNAGFETSSTTMSFAVFEISRSEEIQNKAREEARRVLAKHGGEWTYEAMMELKYIQQIIDETLRRYPPVTILNRECSRDFKIDNTIIAKGTKVFIPTYGIHMDPKYYPNPTEFDPERFTEEAKRARHPFAYLPFGEGPRMCIGMRFALMQIRVGIAQLLLHNRLVADPSVKVPLTFDKGFMLSANELLMIQCQKI